MATDRRVCLFAQFDPAGRIRPHVLRYLAHLAACGFVTHVACSGVAGLAPEDCEALRRIGAVPHPRPNEGLDFGAWQHLLRAGCAEGADEILLANDSVFGPFADLRPLFQSMRARGVEVWGMVASLEGVWHLQSWFVCFSARAFAHPAVRRVFDQPFAAMRKPELVVHGELGLGVAIRGAGLACAAIHEEPAGSRLRRLVRINPMHLDWAWMLTRGGVPFVKAELLRDNPIGIWWAKNWPAVLGRLSDDLPREITQALANARSGAGADAPTTGHDGLGQSARRRWRTLLLYLLLTRDKPMALRALGDALLPRRR